jgi:hypothetical protein
MLLPIKNISDTDCGRVVLNSLYGSGKDPGMAPKNGNLAAFL